MPTLSTQGYGYFLIMCNHTADLQRLAHLAGLKIAAGCKCSTQCKPGSGLIGYQNSVKSLAVVSACRSFEEYRSYGGSHTLDLYLVKQLGHFNIHTGQHHANLAAVVSPSFQRRQRPPAFRVGLNFNLGGGGPLPLPAQNLIKLVEQQWPTKPTALF